MPMLQAAAAAAAAWLSHDCLVVSAAAHIHDGMCGHGACGWSSLTGRVTSLLTCCAFQIAYKLSCTVLLLITEHRSHHHHARGVTQPIVATAACMSQPKLCCRTGSLSWRHLACKAYACFMLGIVYSSFFTPGIAASCAVHEVAPRDHA
ncbi:hypothetical protein COO60DRAFT_1528509 [Scenedesmus sp. NREL 46B-D3]|nr:hypothetical protein COO60DRAFT_1528509 [Scenedesmus sp. NREL 46B-D3]